MLLNGKKVFVGRFIPRKEREKELGEKARRFTNVYVKNFGTELDEEKLKEMFEQFGTISSLKVVTGEDGSSKGKWVLGESRSGQLVVCGLYTVQ